MTTPKLLLILAAAASLGRGAPPPVLDVGQHKQLFIDDRFVTAAAGLEWKVNPPEKAGVVLRGTESWENGYLSAYGTVLDDGGKYRMWYVAGPAVADGKVDEAVSRLCYAESDDAVHWTKPHLGLYTWQGSTQNNILLEGSLENADVMIDPRAPASERYKLIGRLQVRSPRWPNGTAPDGTGLYAYTSPDGLRWQLHPQRVFPFDCDTLNMALYDGRTGRYLAYVRTWNPFRRVGVVETDDLLRPWPFDASAPPNRFYLPGEKEPYGPPTAPSREVPDAFRTDPSDPPNLDFYTSAVVKYPWAQDAYLMFPSAYRHFPEPPIGRNRNDGTVDIDLAVSRDGRKFHRLSHQPYIGLGLKGSLDDSTLYMFIGMLRRDNCLYQYYEGNNVSHGTILTAAQLHSSGALFLARSRLDGMVSLEAGAAGGHFVTPLLRFHGKHLVLNLDASATGEVEVELQDQAGRPVGYDYDSDSGSPVGGFTFAHCDPIRYNDLARVVTWRQGDADLSRLEGQPVRLSFRMHSAKLYSFQFSD